MVMAFYCAGISIAAKSTGTSTAGGVDDVPYQKK